MRIVIAGNYGAQNIGDEMILEGLITSIKRAHPKSKITVLSADPEDTQKRHNVDSVKQFPTGFRSIFRRIFYFKSETGKVVKNCDLFILGGGGLFGSLTFKANIIWGTQALMAYKYKKPVAMIGQSIGLLKGILRKMIVKYLFNRAKLIVVRDRKSAKRLKKLNVKKKIHIHPDFAFQIATSRAHKRTKVTLVCLRQIESNTLLFKKEVANFLDWLIQKEGHKIQFLDFKTPNDHKLHSEVHQLMEYPKDAEHLPTPKSSKELLETFSKAEFALTMRLHSAIASIKTSTAFITINYAPKVEALLQEYNLSHYLLPLHEFSSEFAISKFKNAKKHPSVVEKDLEQANKTIVKQNAQQIFFEILPG